MNNPAVSVGNRREGAALEIETAAVLAGLQASPRRVSARYFYDERGSLLFEEICRQPEYYPTRTEARILHQYRAELADVLGAGVMLVEPGSGSAEKTAVLLQALAEPAGYVPVEVCREQLLQSARRLAGRFPGLPIAPACADFTLPFDLPPLVAHRRKVVFFPGSTIGNFTVAEATTLLRDFSRLAGPGGGLLIGVDLVKAPGILHDAYNDAAGVTARFNLNILRHLNRRFGSNFDPASFRHAAVWRPVEQRIEMRLLSSKDQLVQFAGHRLEFAAGQKLVTEWSHKYTPDGFAQLAAEAGWNQKHVWLDQDRWFSVQYFETCGDVAPAMAPENHTEYQAV